MKVKNMLLGLLAVVVVALVTGCPQGIPVIPPTETNPPVEQIPDGMGMVETGGDLNDAKTLDKSIDLNDVVDFFKGQATTIQFNFYPAQGTTSTVPVGKGGDLGNTVSFTIPITDGKWHDKFLLKANYYGVDVAIYDGNYNALFWANSDVTITAGEKSKLDLFLSMAEYYNFSFKVANLPGQYDNNGTATITTDSGESYTAYYYTECVDCMGMGKSLPSDSIVFSVYLPVSFSGVENGAVLLGQDAVGEPYATKLNFDIFATKDGVFEINYDYPNDVGSVDINIIFPQYH